jgi:hypothetical protein
MKLSKTYILTLGLITIGMTACKKDFLQRDPQTEITEGSFFQSPADLETYSNGFYGYLSPSYSDINSDNIANYNADGEVDLLVRGGLSSANASGWDKKDWEALRKINFMLDHIPQVKGDPANLPQYSGMACFRFLCSLLHLRHHSGLFYFLSHNQQRLPRSKIYYRLSGLH